MKKVMPRTSRVLDKMRRGEKAISFKINSESPRLVETAHKYGKFAGTVAGKANLKELYDMGYDFLNCGSEVSTLNVEFEAIAAAAAAAGV